MQKSLSSLYDQSEKLKQLVWNFDSFIKIYFHNLSCQVKFWNQDHKSLLRKRKFFQEVIDLENFNMKNMFLQYFPYSLNKPSTGEVINLKRLYYLS